VVEDLVDTTEAVQLAPRVWWVGSMIPDDRFQCHACLIEQGDQSVLVDPGSALISHEIIRKIESVTPLTNVRWLVCSHADPDIIGALPALVAHGLHPEARIVTFWRDETLIVHSGTPLKFWRIEDHDWALELEDRTLRFILTPYLHFAGAFCTYDEESETLFSSDLFGGFTLDTSLYATSMDYFDAIRAFHEHYMPSREILTHTLEELRRLTLRRITPQHGQVIPEHLIIPIMDSLEALECGIYLLARNEPGLRFILNANHVVKGVVDVLIQSKKFSEVVEHLSKMAAQVLRTDYLELWATRDDLVVRFDESDGFRGRISDPPIDVQLVLHGSSESPGQRLLMPITSPSTSQIIGAVVLGFAETTILDQPTLAVLSQLASFVEVGLEREMITRAAQSERAAWQLRAMHDSLTGLLNRASLVDTFTELIDTDQAGGHPPMAALMIDLDLFKLVNDNFGHVVGDQVLQHVAQSIKSSIRPTDLAFRYGGEEFLVLLSGVDSHTAITAAERIRSRVSDVPAGLPPVTLSVGVAMRRDSEDPKSLIARCDEALYTAKQSGRNQVAHVE
jgi:diguanylate cyclase (GGDEF)-like protein